MARRSPRALRAALLLAAVAALFAAAGCIPQDKGAASEVGDPRAGRAGPPVFPETGQVSADLLEQGLVYDLTNAPGDLSVWVPSDEEARCAARKIVANLAPRLNELGYLPGKSGASLNDLALTDTEKATVSSLFQSCVDMQQAVAALLMGDGNMTSAQASCMATGLHEQGMTPRFADAWVYGTGVDPFANDGDLAEAVLAYTEICLPDRAFAWPGVKLPGDTEVTGAGEGDSGSSSGGSSGGSGDLPSSAGKVTTTTAASGGGTGGAGTSGGG